MHPDIEKLIDYAISGGQISEKERNVVLKKAFELGLNLDEVEMTLNGRLHQLKNHLNKLPKEKVGNIKTCPACGAEKSSFSINCKLCGHEFVNSKEISIIAEFNHGLNSVPKTTKGATFVCNRCNKCNIILYENTTQCNCYYCKTLCRIGENLYNEDLDLKAKYIENFPIPNDKESVLNILFHLASLQAPKSFDLDGEDPTFNYRKAVRGKIIQIIEISKVMFLHDAKLMDQLHELERKIKVTDKKEILTRNFVGIFSMVLVVIIMTVVVVNFDINELKEFSWKMIVASALSIGFLFWLVAKYSR